MFFSYDAQSLEVGSGTITATIKAVGKNLDAKKLDINAGLGLDNLGIVMAHFPFALDNASSIGNVSLRLTSGIPDRAFGDAGYNFVYIPVKVKMVTLG